MLHESHGSRPAIMSLPLRGRPDPLERAPAKPCRSQPIAPGRIRNQVDRVFMRCYIARFVLQPRPSFAPGEPFHGIIRRNRP